MAMPFRRILFYAFAGLVLVGVVASSYLWWSTSIGRFPGLEARVTEYYALEAKQQWADTYRIRAPAFRNTVPKTGYIPAMEEDAKGWKLNSVKILYAISDNNLVRVKIQFSEMAPKGYYRIPVPENFPGLSESEREKINKLDSNLKDKAMESTISDWSVWQNIDGVWYAWDAGTRSHMSQNAGLVAPY